MSAVCGGTSPSLLPTVTPAWRLASGRLGLPRMSVLLSGSTPPLGSPLVGGWESPPADFVYEELHVHALLPDDGQTRLAIALSDSLGISCELLDSARRAVHAKTGMPMEHMLFAATHTHSAASAGSCCGAPSCEPFIP